MNTNNGYIDILGVFSCPEPFINTTTGVMETLDVITTSDVDLENNGVIYIEDWTNEGTVFGSGSFCIENCFQNIGNINGTLDVYDANPGGGPGCDFNFGTIAPTVTICAAGPCGGKSGLTNSTILVDVKLFPNPSSDGRFSIETDANITAIRMFDLSGLELFEKSSGNLKTLDLSFLTNGEYLIVLQTENNSSTKKVLIH